METRTLRSLGSSSCLRPDRYGGEHEITGVFPSGMHPARISIAVVPIALPNLRLIAARTVEADAPWCARYTWSTPRWMFAATVGTKSGAYPMSMRTATSTLVYHRTLTSRV